MNQNSPFQVLHSANAFHLIELDHYRDLDAFLEALGSRVSEYIFRGQTDAEWSLEPRLARELRYADIKERPRLRRLHLTRALFELRGRVEFQADLAACLRETSRLEDNPTSSLHGTPTMPKSSELLNEFWAFAQHHQLATPLLDWSLAPYIAQFFAVEAPVIGSRHYAAFYALHRPSVDMASAENGDDGLDFVTPIRFANDRLSAQRGLFTSSRQDTSIEKWVGKAFEDQHHRPVLFKLIFPLTEEERGKCLFELRQKNITHSSVYPDVFGATQHANILLSEQQRISARPTRDASSKPNSDVGIGSFTVWVDVEPPPNGESDHHESANAKIVQKRPAAIRAAFVNRGNTLEKPPPHGCHRSKWTFVTTPLKEDADSVGCAYVIKIEGQRPPGFEHDMLFLKTPAREHVTEEQLGAIHDVFKAESSSLLALKDLGEDQVVAEVVGAISLQPETDELGRELHWPSTGLPVLFHRYCEGDALSKFIETAEPISAPNWFKLAKTLTDILRRVHNRGVLHAAIAPRHVLIRSAAFDQVALVGFGSSSLLHQSRKVAARRSAWTAPEVHEREDLLGPLSFSTDVYSLGMVLLWAATKEVPTIQTPLSQHPVVLKKQVTKRIKERNPELAKCNSISKVIDKCLRTDPQDRFSCMEELLDALRYSEGEALEADKVSEQNYDRAVTFLAEMFPATGSRPSHDSAPHPFFQRLLWRQLQRVSKDTLEKIRTGHFEVYGHRDMLIDHLCSYLNLLEPGQTYLTVSLPGYWTDENLGSDGRFLVKNRDLVEKRVIIKRVFLVPGDFVELPYAEQRVLLAHLEAVKEFATTHPGLFQVKVFVTTDAEDLLSFEKTGNAVALIENSRRGAARSEDFAGLALRFVSTGERFKHNGRYYIRRKIRKLRFSALTAKGVEQEKGNMIFTHRFDRGIELQEYINPSRTDDLLRLLR